MQGQVIRTMISDAKAGQPRAGKPAIQKGVLSRFHGQLLRRILSQFLKPRRIRQRKKYSLEFKHEAAELVRPMTDQLSPAIAIEIGINPNLFTWLDPPGRWPGRQRFTARQHAADRQELVVA